MPFADEIQPVSVVDYRPDWPADFERLADRLRAVLGADALAVDHVGSTSVPGLAAKDCVDVQVRMALVDEARDVPRLAAIGFRCRPEPWNRSETSSGQVGAKLVFAPPAGTRSCNVHLRQNTGAGARYALLFRDFLRADDEVRRSWGEFKRQLARSAPDLLDYGRIKGPATDVLMAAAERWAAGTGWSPAGTPQAGSIRP
jgi:GrpB-like predicted nucleotidyltransferase (UPF0157 family)